MKTSLRSICFLALSICLLHAEVKPVPATRTALLMGAWNYTDETFPHLPEAGIHGDLMHMKAKLESLGFQVTVVENPTSTQAEKAVDVFGAQLKARGGASLFYFTGHGAEHEGKNYLVPVGNTNITEGADLKEKALAAGRILSRMESSGTEVNMVFLDCCRNQLSKNGGDEGMAPMQAKGTLIGFATRSGDVADTTTKGSPYTNALLAHLADPGVSLPDMHTLVTGELVKSGSVRRPGNYSDLHDIYQLVPASLSRSDDRDMQAQIERRARELAAKMTPGITPQSEIRNPQSEIRDAFTNSLGMKFVPVPGTQVLFCVHETRVADFAAFVAGSPGYDYSSGGEPYTEGIGGRKQRSGFSWKQPGFTQTDDHPVTCVSWEDADAFCKWLSGKEGKTYRLPTDHEWSVAVGIGEREDASASPAERSMKIIKDVYPWGGDFPPNKGAGNYAGQESKIGRESISWDWIEGYRDDYPRTAPVMKFASNKLGIYDLSGNVWEWCEDWYNTKQKFRVLRGGSWSNSSAPSLLSADRLGWPSGRYDIYGFRVVLVVGAGG